MDVFLYPDDVDDIMCDGKANIMLMMLYILWTNMGLVLGKCIKNVEHDSVVRLIFFYNLIFFPAEN